LIDLVNIRSARSSKHDFDQNCCGRDNPWIDPRTIRAIGRIKKAIRAALSTAANKSLR
jgi:hypothetical protein